MEFIFEFLLEVVVEALITIGGNRKAFMWLHVMIKVIVVIFLLMMAIGWFMLIIKIWDENKLLALLLSGLLLIVVATGYTVLKKRMYLKTNNF